MTQAEAERWLAEFFEYAYCDECGGDAEDHHVIIVLENPFAQCLRTAEDNKTQKRGMFAATTTKTGAK